MNETVYIGLGSNLGDRERNLVDAVEALSRIDAVAVVARSSLWDTAPVGPPQPRYLNAVVGIECGLPPKQLLSILKQIERDLGRTPGERWTARLIDLDILLWGNQVIAEPKLQIPHLGLHQRRFVLEPLAQLAPGLVHPLLGVSIRALCDRAAPQDVIPHPATHWPEPPRSPARELVP